MKLIDKLPSFYYENKEVNSIQGAFDIERETLEINVIDLINQLFVSTATEWGLALWEEMLGLRIDNSLSIDVRRAIILSKIKSNTVATKEAIRKVCQDFTNKKVEVIENNSEYSFTVNFIGGDVYDTKRLIKEINDMKPAHLAFNIINSIASIIKINFSKGKIANKYYCSNQIVTSSSTVNTYIEGAKY